MMQSVSSIARICRDEIRTILRDQGVVLFIFVVPLLYPVLYAFIYTNEVVREVPVAVVDDSNSPLSRKFVRMLDASPGVRVAARCSSMAEAEDLNRHGEIYGIVRIPSELNKQLLRGEQATIGVYADMAGMLYYKSLLLAATDVSLLMNKQLKVQRHYLGATGRQEQIATQPIEYDYVTLFNTQNGFGSFLLPPVLMLILQQTLMLGLGMTGGARRERYGDIPMPYSSDWHNPFHIIAGRTIPYFNLYLLLAMYMFVAIHQFFGFPQLGDYFTFFIFIVPFLLACIFMGIVFSAFIYRREDCILLFVFMSVPLLFISGISWPGASVPEFWQWVGTLFPSTYATNGYVRIQTMGASLHQVRHEWNALWIQAGVYFFLSIVFYRREILKRLKKSRPKLAKVAKKS